MKIFISPAKKINEEKVVFDNSKSTKFHFNKEVKYGYLSVGKVLEGPKDMLDKIIATKFEYIDETYKEIKKEIPKHKKKCYEKYQEELDFNEEQRRQLEDSLYIAIMNCTKMLGLKVK